MKLLLLVNMSQCGQAQQKMNSLIPICLTGIKKLNNMNKSIQDAQQKTVIIYYQSMLVVLGVVQ